MEKISRERFIRLGTALGVGAAGASLAACGGGAGSSGGAGSGGGESGGGNSGGDKPKGGAQAEGGGEAQGGEAQGGEAQGGEAQGGEAQGGEAQGGGKEAGGAAIASVSEVAPGSALTFKDAGNPAVLIHLDNGDFVAYSAVCTHQNCTVPYKNGQLVCPCHGSVFDPADGAAVVTGPAQSPLPEIPVKVQNGEIVKA